MSEGRKKVAPERMTAQGLVRLGAPSIQLFPAGLRPRRAWLRFTGRQHYTESRAKSPRRPLTRSEVAFGAGSHAIWPCPVRLEHVKLATRVNGPSPIGGCQIQSPGRYLFAGGTTVPELGISSGMP